EGKYHCHLRQIPACQLTLWHVGLTSRHAKGTRIASLESSAHDSGPLDLPLGSAPHFRRWSHDYHPRLRRRRKRLDHRDGKPTTAILSFSRHEFQRIHDVHHLQWRLLLHHRHPHQRQCPFVHRLGGD